MIAKFYEQDGKTMIVVGVDPHTRIGPREMTDADKENHAAAWMDYGGEAPAPKPKAKKAKAVTGDADVTIEPADADA